MNHLIIKTLIVLLCALTLIACKKDDTKPDAAPVETTLPAPTKDILVTDGNITQKYTILGQVEYTPEDGKSIYSNQLDDLSKNKDILKRVAFSKYGDKVDAIINFKVNQSLRGGFWGAVGAGYGAHSLSTHVEGLAVAFQKDADTDTSAATKPASTTGKSKSKKKK